MKLGLVGLGPMGSRMARRLINAGHELTVWNRSPDRAEPLRASGAAVAATPADAAAGAEFVLSMVANDEALRTVTLGENGIASGLEAGAVHVSSGTVSIALAKSLAEAHAHRGQHLLSVTVLGRPPAVEAGKLYLMAAGQSALIERFRPAADALGQRMFVVGDEPWTSNLVKLCANFMILSTIEQLAEVFAICGKAGIPEATAFEVLSSSFCNAPVHLNYGRLILDRAFSPAGTLMATGEKDNASMLEAGADLGVPMPIASLLRDRFLTSLAKGEHELDFAAISRRAREDAGLPLE